MNETPVSQPHDFGSRGRGFLLEDDYHSDWIETFESYDEALAYLKTIVQTPWGTALNDPPCGDLNCERWYVIVEYESTDEQLLEKGQRAAVRVSATGIEWQNGPTPG